MVNIIERNHPGNIKAYSSQTSKVRGNEKAPEIKSVSDPCEDRVFLSSMAKDIQMAKSQLEAIPDVRIEKVTEIKNQISQGTYSVSSEKIAHHLMGESLLNEIL